ncbi:MAG: hypothetical protein JXR07_03480 [Reichenbachiella sp.]
MEKGDLKTIRKNLLAKEKNLRSSLDEQTNKVGNVINDNIARVALIGTGVIASYFIFNSLAPSKRKKKKGKKNKTRTSGNSKVAKTIITEALKTVIPLAIEKIKLKEELNSK